MILKVVGMSWLTVVRMLQVNGGFRSPEDLRKTPLNPSPDPKQLERNEAVDRIRRIQLNDLENVPFFLVAHFAHPHRAVSNCCVAAARRLCPIEARALRRLFHCADPRRPGDALDHRLADPHLPHVLAAPRRIGGLTRRSRSKVPVVQIWRMIPVRIRWKGRIAARAQSIRKSGIDVDRTLRKRSSFLIGAAAAPRSTASGDVGDDLVDVLLAAQAGKVMPPCRSCTNPAC